MLGACGSKSTEEAETSQSFQPQCESCSLTKPCHVLASSQESTENTLIINTITEEQEGTLFSLRTCEDNWSQRVIAQSYPPPSACIKSVALAEADLQQVHKAASTNVYSGLAGGEDGVIHRICKGMYAHTRDWREAGRGVNRMVCVEQGSNRKIRPKKRQYQQ